MSSPWRATLAFIAATMLLPASLTATASPSTAAPADAFVSTWDTRNLSIGSSGLNQIRLPLQTDGSYNFTVDWGDDTSSVITWSDQPEATHTYTTPGEYTLTIAGDLRGWAFFDAGDRLKIGNVSQWGDINFGNKGYWFSWAENLTATATDSPDLSGTTNMTGAFQRASSFNGLLGNWDTSAATDMTNMFYGASAFHQDIGGWDVSNVNSMQNMFYGASVFNQDIGGWDVSNVSNFRGMFDNAKAFNQDIGGWNTSSAITMESMFTLAKAFNQNIGGWNVSNVINMESMFHVASAFNQDIGGWDVSRVTDMEYLFRDASAFNQDIGGWDVSRVTDMSLMFTAASAFDQDIGGWNVSRVTDMSQMFSSASAFNQDIGGWDVSRVTEMFNMFGGVGLSLPNYDSLLIGWASRPILAPDVNFSGGYSRYTIAAQPSRQVLIDTHGWTITDGGIAWPGFSAAPSSLGFGDQTVSTTSAARSVTITNTGIAPLIFGTGTLALGGDTPSQYTITAETCSGSSIAPSQTCSVDVTFTPTSSGASTAILIFEDNAPGSPHAVGLSGNGVQIPGAPTNVQAVRGDRHAVVLWTAPDDGASPITGYDYRLDGGAWTDLGTTASPASISGLTNGTTYQVRIRAVNAVGDGPASAPVAVTPGTIPSAPRAVTAVRGDKKASVSWQAPADNGGFAVTGYTATAQPGGATCATDGDGRDCDITGLTNGSTYTVHVTATNAVGTSNDAVASVTPATTPTVPLNVTAARGDQKVAVSWDAPADDGGLPISAYVATATPGGATCETTGGLSCDITGLTNGTGYTVRVVAFNDAGGSPASDPSPPVTPGTAPSVPRGVTAVRGDKKASVSWQAPADNGGFAVTGYTATAQPGGATCATDGDGRDCDITGLTNGSTYTVHVTATNAVGTSNDAVASVTPATTPGAPSGVAATPGFRTASVSWQASVSNGGDPILAYTVVANPGGRTCTASGGQCVVTGLSDFKTYTFTVTARNSVGEGSVSEPSAAITLSGDEVIARLTVASQVGTGEPLVLDARASTSLSGQIATYEWDFGDGTFAEGSSTVSHVWAQRGVRTVRVRVTSDGGMTDTATASIEVFAGSPREPGVSIDQGAPYTTSRDVTLTLGWPDKSRQARISNDGGFADAQTIDVDDAIPWVLDDSVEVVATQVVYVRFLGPGVDASRTFTDNIIFDNTAPALTQVTAVPKTSNAQSASIRGADEVRVLAGRRLVWRVAVKASDDRSGMGRLQVNASRRSKGAVSVQYRPKARVTLTGGSRKVFVRVSDKAGNWTKWKKAKVILRRR